MLCVCFTFYLLKLHYNSTISVVHHHLLCEGLIAQHTVSKIFNVILNSILVDTQPDPPAHRSRRNRSKQPLIPTTSADRQLNRALWPYPRLRYYVPDRQVVSGQCDRDALRLTWRQLDIRKALEYRGGLAGRGRMVYVDLRDLDMEVGLVREMVERGTLRAVYTSPPNTLPVFRTLNVTLYAGSCSLHKAHKHPPTN